MKPAALLFLLSAGAASALGSSMLLGRYAAFAFLVGASAFLLLITARDYSTQARRRPAFAEIKSPRRFSRSKEPLRLAS